MGWRAAGVAFTAVIGVAVTVTIASYDAHREDTPECRLSRPDSVAIARRAVDTVTRLRGTAQRVTVLRRENGVVGIRTEDTSRAAFHDGGLVWFSCRGRVRLVWLDGG